MSSKTKTKKQKKCRKFLEKMKERWIKKRKIEKQEAELERRERERLRKESVRKKESESEIPFVDRVILDVYNIIKKEGEGEII